MKKNKFFKFVKSYKVTNHTTPNWSHYSPLCFYFLLIFSSSSNGGGGGGSSSSSSSCCCV